ncbi:MAG TPA: glutamine--fructose-6-phosphate transaminase (isomerizing) [Actinomycetota bacterium]|nr:glutamine--fructose-6-phosphate transaminase (isomerizing) [Actinomycetota bacterium]
MCGIVGCVGSDDALQIMLDGLRKLEYRGYDSAGVAVVSDGELVVERRAGRLGVLEGHLNRSWVEGSMGIGHTRWATHGAPTDANAHPHRDCSGRIAIVHNGIIENHDVLRAKLTEEGHRFRSQTDTEVVAHLLESLVESRAGGLRQAVLEAVKILEGAFALVCISLDEPDTIVVARQEPPLIVGATDEIGLVASDIPALLAHTRDVVPLDNRQVAEVTPGRVRVFGFDGIEVTPETVHVEWDAEAAEKGGYEDFMLKEIFEQPAAVRNTMRGRFAEDGRVTLDEVKWDPGIVRDVDKIVVVACGTSFHAGMAAKHSIEHWTRIPVELDLASEFRYRDPVLDDRSLVIGIAQSGETADTLAAVKFAKEMGASVVAVTNVVGSSMTREADAVLFTHAGPEIGVAATKTFTAQLVALNVLALYLAQERGTMPADKRAETIAAMQRLPEQVEEVLRIQGEVHRAAKRYADAKDFIFIGRGVGMAVAMEGALKLKEISYIHAEGYAAGELKHGAIALIEPGVPVVAVLTGHLLYDKMLANVEEVRARGADTILIAPQGDDRARSLANELFEVPASKPLLTPILDTIPLQLFAYYVCKERGLPPDKPRNLAKSVTVE